MWYIVCYNFQNDKCAADHPCGAAYVYVAFRRSCTYKCDIIKHSLYVRIFDFIIDLTISYNESIAREVTFPANGAPCVIAN